MTHIPPQDMVIVERDVFFQALYADKRDIMPSVRMPYYTTWETKTREVWGWSYPGWKNLGEACVYAIHPSALPKEANK